MKPVAEWTRADLEGLIGLEEGQGLDFKASPALTNNDWKKEIAKDVSAMANAAGGVIVYGLTEDGSGVANAIDEGVEKITPETIERVLNANVEPRMEGVVVQRIPLNEGRSAFAIEVPQSTSLPPHQSRPAQKYFRRHGKEVLAMYDHEIRDLMRRRLKPKLKVVVDVSPTGLDPNIYVLEVSLYSYGEEPVLYASVDLLFDIQLKYTSPGMRFIVVDEEDRQHACDHHTANFRVPETDPLYREKPQMLVARQVFLAPNTGYAFAYRISAPGFHCIHSLTIGRQAGGPLVTEDDYYRVPVWEQQSYLSRLGIA